MSSAVGGPEFNFGGLATGLDTGALIEALMAVERRPLQLAQQRKSALEQQRNLFQEFNKRVETLREALGAVDNRSTTLAANALDEELLEFTAVSEDEAAVRADASGNASPGSYDVEVTQLAAVGREITVGFADATTPVFAQGETLTIDHGGTSPIDITIAGAGGASLQDLRDAINADPENGGAVQASIINVGGTDPYRLVIAGTATGVSNDIALGGTLAGGGNFDAALSQDARDAQFRVFGIDFSREGNEVADAIPGVTLRFLAETATPTVVTVSRDDEAIAAKLQDVVDAVNGIRGFVREQSAVNPETNRGGPLSGDPTLRGVESTMLLRLGGSYAFAGNPFTNLTAIGLRFDAQGELALDEEKLAEALTQDPTAVAELLSGRDDGSGFVNGVFAELGEALGPIVESVDGTLALRDAALQSQIDSIDGQIANFETRLEQREQTLTARFTALEVLVAGLQAQSTYLASI